MAKGGKSKGKSDWGKVKSVMVMCIVRHSNGQIGEYETAEREIERLRYTNNGWQGCPCPRRRD